MPPILFRILLALLLLAPAAWSAPTEFDLPGDYAQFVIHPETGDIIAIDPVLNQVHLFRRDRLDAARVAGGEGPIVIDSPDAMIEVGPTPVSVCYKVFGDDAFYAVVCTQHAKMYIIDAQRFELRHAIDLTGGGSMVVAGSLNAEDPFLYYTYFTSGSSETGTGVVDTRAMADRGTLFSATFDLELSPDGQTLYRRGPHSPSGFQSEAMLDGFDQPMPRFVEQYYEHNTVDPYQVDPNGQLVVSSSPRMSGCYIYDATLAQRLGELPFSRVAFSKTRAVIFGYSDQSLDTRRGNPHVTIGTASYNTLKPLGDEVSVRLPRYDSPGTIAHNIGGRPAPLEGRRPLLACDDPRDQVVFAYRARLLVWPLDTFELPDEPVLRVRLAGPTRLLAGETYRFEIAPVQDDVEIAYNDLPEGMTVDGDHLHWTPTVHDVGYASLRLTATHEGVHSLSQRIDLHVAYPSITLPFVAEHLAVDRTGSRAVVWANPPEEGNRPQPADPPQTQAAVINLEAGTVLAHREFSERITDVTIAGEHAVFWPSAGETRCRVYRLDGLTHVTDFVAAAPVLDCRPFGDWLVVHGRETLEIYDTQRFERVRFFGGDTALPYTAQREAHNRQYAIQVYDDALYIQQSLMLDTELRPSALFSYFRLPCLAVAQNHHPGLTLPDAITDRSEAEAMRDRMRESETAGQSLGSGLLYNLQAGVLLQREYKRVQLGEGDASLYVLCLHHLSIHGRSSQYLIARYDRSSHRDDSKPALYVGGEVAVVLNENRLYLWAYPESQRPIQTSPPMRWSLRQTAITLSGGETTSLEHPVRGGRPPFRYRLVNEQPSLQMDNQTGTITVDNAAVLAEAASLLADRLRNATNETSIGVVLDRHEADQQAQAQALLGPESTGLAVALPIRVEVTDQEQNSLVIQYHMILEVPRELVAETLRWLRSERLAREQEARDQRETEGERLRREVGERMQALEDENRALRQQLRRLERRLEDAQRDRGLDDDSNVDPG